MKEVEEGNGVLTRLEQEVLSGRGGRTEVILVEREVRTCRQGNDSGGSCKSLVCIRLKTAKSDSNNIGQSPLPILV